MSRNFSKKITRSLATCVSVATIFGFVPGLALFAHAAATFSADTAITLSNGNALTIVSGSSATSVTVNATANTITVVGASGFTIKSSNNKALVNDSGYSQCTLVSNVPQLTFTNAGTVIFSPTAVDCNAGVTYTAGSGGGGGGGGAAAAVASVVSITSPSANTSLTAGSTKNVTWSVTGSDITKIEVDYAKDGTAYAQVAKDLSPSSGSYAWIVPSITTNTGMLKLIGTNASGAVVSTSTVAVKIVSAATTPTTPVTTPTTTPTTTPAETTTPVSQPSSNAAPVAVLIHDPSKFDELLAALGTTAKPADFAKYKPLVKSDALAFKVSITDEQQTAIANFITYGASAETVKLGAGERRAVVRDYFETVGKADLNWDDVQRMTTGQKLVHRNLPKEQAQATRVLANFKLMVGHAPNFKDAKEDIAWNTMMYRIRFPRDLKVEQEGIVKFKKIYKHAPASPLEWSIVRALGYALK